VAVRLTKSHDIDSPRNMNRNVAQPRSLTEAVQQVADCPCEAHQRGFLDVLACVDELIFKVAGTDVPLTDGEQRRVTSRDRIRLQQVVVQAHNFLLAFPDLDAARRHDPAGTYAGISLGQAVAMTLADPTVDGILVSAASSDDAWAAAPRSSLTGLL
jgi:hypothetical protein